MEDSLDALEIENLTDDNGNILKEVNWNYSSLYEEKNWEMFGSKHVKVLKECTIPREIFLFLPKPVEYM